MHERELPMLAGIARCIHWIEELLNILNGPILMFGAGIALVDLLTDGALTASSSLLLYAWAVSQALGVDTQLLGCFSRARRAADAQMFRSVAAWVALGGVLGYFAWQAGYVFALQQAYRVSEAAALHMAGIDGVVWLMQRAGLAVGLVALSGWTRYSAPRAEDAGDEEARLHREIELVPLRQRLREARARGFVGVARETLAAVRDAPVVPGDDAIDSAIVAADPRMSAALPDAPAGDAAPASHAVILPGGLMTGPMLRTYVRGTYGQEISDDTALALIKATPGARRLKAGVKGAPWAAPTDQVLVRARQSWEHLAAS